MIIPASLFLCTALVPENAAAQARASLVEAQKVITNLETGKARRLLANLRAMQIGDIAANISGSVAQIYVSVGDYVEKGASLAKLDDRQYQHQLEIMNSQVAMNEAQLETAKRNFEKLQTEVDRLDKLRGSSAFSPARYEVAELEAYVVAAEIEERQASLAGAIANRNLARLDLEWTSIIAPYNGIILARNLVKGDYVSSGTSGFQMMNVNSVEVEAALPADMVAEITAQPLAHIEFENIEPKAGAGEAAPTIAVSLRAIIPQEDPRTGTRKAYFKLQAHDDDIPLADGMSVTLIHRAQTIQSQAAQLNIFVPKDALVINGDQISVFVVETKDDTKQARRQMVQTGQTVGALIQITDGLSADDTIVTKGNERLSDGASLRIMQQ